MLMNLAWSRNNWRKKISINKKCKRIKMMSKYRKMILWWLRTGCGSIFRKRLLLLRRKFKSRKLTAGANWWKQFWLKRIKKLKLINILLNIFKARSEVNIKRYINCILSYNKLGLKKRRKLIQGGKERKAMMKICKKKLFYRRILRV